MEDARAGLKLLKSRMSQGNRCTGSAKREIENQPSDKMGLGRRANYGAASANKPPMKPPTGYSMPQNGADMTPQQPSNNYRKAFKPNLGNSTNSGIANQMDSVHQDSRTVSKYHNNVQYEPEKRSEHIPRRQLSTNRKTD